MQYFVRCTDRIEIMPKVNRQHTAMLLAVLVTLTVLLYNESSERITIERHRLAYPTSGQRESKPVNYIAKVNSAKVKDSFTSTSRMFPVMLEETTSVSRRVSVQIGDSVSETLSYSNTSVFQRSTDNLTNVQSPSTTGFVKEYCNMPEDMKLGVEGNKYTNRSLLYRYDYRLHKCFCFLCVL